MPAAIEQRIQSLGERLNKEVLEVDINAAQEGGGIPSVEVCRDLLEELKKESQNDNKTNNNSNKNNITLEVLEKTKIGKLLTKTIKSFKRHHRTADEDTTKEEWSSLIHDASDLLSQWKAAADQEAKEKAKEKLQDKDKKSKKTKQTSHSSRPNLPETASEYRTRLVAQKKEMYKDPPVLPPMSIQIESKKYPRPKRDEDTGLLRFTASDDEVKKQLQDFQPNRTPEEVLRAGSFGGTYFRPIVSAVTNIAYKSKDVLEDTVEKEWIEGLGMDMLTSKTYRPQINKFGVKCGGSLGMWESSGWIVESDPYGWFQWYCRFYSGRRSSDDSRQISRWLKSAGPKGRFRSQLCNKILNANTQHDDPAISPVIRQTMLHWGLEITPTVLATHKHRVGR